MGQQFLFGVIISLGLSAIPAWPQAGDTAHAKTAAEAYHNIQVLKDIPADQLVPAMQFITYSLGVECSYCHVEGALEKDDKKPKQDARRMMQMMAAINRDNFESKQAVTCNSCHRGAAHPVATPVIAEGPVKAASTNAPAEDAGTANGPAAEQIIARYVDAIGGAAALAKFSTREEKGTVSIAGRNLPIEILSRTGGKQLTLIHLPNGDSITAYNGASGWTSGPNRPVREIPSVEVASARPEVDLQLALHMNQLFEEVKTAAPETIGGRETYVVAGIHAGEVAAKFYFDKESGYLLRMLRYTSSPLGRNPTQVDYENYRAQDGIKIPFHLTISRPNSRLEIQIEEARVNVPVDDAKFSPPAPQALPGNTVP